MQHSIAIVDPGQDQTTRQRLCQFRIVSRCRIYADGLCVVIARSRHHRDVHVKRQTPIEHDSQKVKVKVRLFYSSTYEETPRPAALYNRRKWQLIGKSQWCWSVMLQLQHTPPLQSTTAGLHPVSIHQIAPHVRGSRHPIAVYYSVYRPWDDERLSCPSWLTCSGRFTHISGHPSAAGRAQDRERSPTKERRSTTVPRHQLSTVISSAT